MIKQPPREFRPADLASGRADIRPPAVRDAADDQRPSRQEEQCHHRGECRHDELLPQQSFAADRSGQQVAQTGPAGLGRHGVAGEQGDDDDQQKAGRGEQRENHEVRSAFLGEVDEPALPGVAVVIAKPEGQQQHQRQDGEHHKDAHGATSAQLSSDLGPERQRRVGRWAMVAGSSRGLVTMLELLVRGTDQAHEDLLELTMAVHRLDAVAGCDQLRHNCLTRQLAGDPEQLALRYRPETSSLQTSDRRRSHRRHRTVQST